jgi:glutamate formiminotransferase / 5-formyltetrahydrofolate cyclo-ligase
VTRRLIECVPNYSEGRRPEVIESIVSCFRSRRGVHVLDARADTDHNRLVVSLVGEPGGPLEDALLDSARAAVRQIDMVTHTGAHPRIGAVDVIPFVPLRGIDMAECVALTRGFAERFARELAIPVYLYESAALRPERRNLEDVRRGQLEALRREIGLPARAPDFGPSAVHPSAGATAVGARPFLIAFNVNLESTDLGAAREIAKTVRASGGGMPCVKAVGIDLAARGMVQVSINITDASVSPVHAVLARVTEEAGRRGIRVHGTELYGMAPAWALLDAAAHALRLEAFDPSQVIDLRLLDLAGEG